MGSMGWGWVMETDRMRWGWVMETARMRWGWVMETDSRGENIFPLISDLNKIIGLISVIRKLFLIRISHLNLFNNLISMFKCIT